MSPMPIRDFSNNCFRFHVTFDSFMRTKGCKTNEVLQIHERRIRQCGYKHIRQPKYNKEKKYGCKILLTSCFVNMRQEVGFLSTGKSVPDIKK